MEPTNILDARNNLSRLVAAASAGDEVVIAKRGVPVARLVPMTGAPARSAARAAAWLTTNAVPAAAERNSDDLDDQITSERAGWE